MMAKVFSFLGVVLAILLSIAVTVPYVIAWWNLSSESREINVVNVEGETYTESGEDHSSLVNVTLISVYPKAAIEARSNMFVMHLAFLVFLDSSITEFICDEIETRFRSLHRNYEYYGSKTLSFWTGTLANFYRKDDGGNIAPFSANVSITVRSARWPPFSPDLTHMLYLTDTIETAPLARLSGRIRTMNNTLYFISVFFNMTRHTTIIYRFNYPPTVWVAYGVSLFIVIAVSINLLYHRSLKMKNNPNNR